jgi:ligand-binding sensor domain-containing protein
LGEETGSFYEDSQGNIWFTAEGYGVYRYDGTNFTQFTTENGLTSNVVLSIMEDDKGQIWFGTWQGICIFDGEKFVNANIK